MELEIKLIDELTLQMQKLKTTSSLISSSLEAQIMPHMEKLEQFRVQAEELQQLNSKLNQLLEKTQIQGLSDGRAVDQLKADILRYQDQIKHVSEKVAAVFSQVQDFYRIQSDTEKYRVSIEKEKEKLSKIEEDTKDTHHELKTLERLSSALHPFVVFLDTIQNEGEISDHHDEIMAAYFLPETMKGVYLRKYSLDETKQEEKLEEPEWINSNPGVEEVSSVNPEVPEMEVEEISEPGMTLEEEVGSKPIPEEIKEDLNEDLAEDLNEENDIEADLNEEDLGDGAIQVSTSAKNKFGVSAFSSDVRKNQSLVDGINIMAKLHVVTKKQLEFLSDYICFAFVRAAMKNPDNIEKGFSLGYYAKTQLPLPEGVETSFFSLSSMGWKATQKENSRKLLAKGKFHALPDKRTDLTKMTKSDVLQYSQNVSAFIDVLYHLRNKEFLQFPDALRDFNNGKPYLTFVMKDQSVLPSPCLLKVIGSESTDELLLEFENYKKENPLEPLCLLLCSSNQEDLQTHHQNMGDTDEVRYFSLADKEFMKFLPETPVDEKKTTEDEHAEEEHSPIDASKEAAVPRHEEVQHPDDLSSTVEIARYLLHADEVLTDTKEVQILINRLIEEDRIPVALTWLQSVAFLGRHLDTLYHQVQMGTGISAGDISYNWDGLSRYFSSAIALETCEDEHEFALLVASLLRTLYKPDTLRDYTLLSFTDKLVRGDQAFFNEYPSVKSMLKTLHDFLNIEPSGFTDSTFMAIHDDSQKAKRIINLKDEARNILNEKPVTNIAMLQINQMLSKCFNQGSDFYNCMKAILNDDKTNLEAMKDFIAQFVDVSVYNGNMDKIAVDDYIEEYWKTLVSSSFKGGLAHQGRKKIEKKIRERVDLIVRWLFLVDSEQSKSRDAEEKRVSISRYRSESLKYGKLAQEELSAQLELQPRAGVHILKTTIQDICGCLENLAEPKTMEFDEFLCSPFIELNMEGIPVIHDQLRGVIGYEPWRRVLEHITAEKMSYRERLNMVLYDIKEKNRDDFGIAQLLKQKLPNDENDNLDFDKACKSASEALEGYIDQFKSEFEMAYMHGSIDEEKKEEMIQLSEEYKEKFLENNNYGFYMRFLSAMIENIQIFAERKKNALKMEYQEVSANFPDEDFPIRRKINELLALGNIGLASEYIDQFRQGRRSVDDEINSVMSFDYHKQFMEEYDGIYSRCLQYKGSPLKSFIPKELRIAKDRQTEFTSRHQSSTEELLRSWPSLMNDNQNNRYVKNFFEQLGFSVKDCVYDTPRQVGQSCVAMKLSVNPVDRNLDYYTHPISRYGTQLDDHLRVICMFGAIGTTEMISTISKIDSIGNNSIILLDSALTKPERRKLAEKFKSSTGWQNSFLVIDRVLTIYLAGMRMEDRIEALLKTTLPYTYYQPYSNDGGFISDEMFFGRKKELASILDPTGACLVYGGRQLGKTALLLRAQSMANKPSNKEYAVFVNAQQLSSEKLLKRVSKELKEIGVLEGETTSWEEICDALRENHKRKVFRKLLILIDEVDDFLSEIKNEGYLPLKELRELRNYTGNQFKFVLAGLHNVTRLEHAMKENSIIPQLGAPLSIKPFGANDAAQLMKIPLSYLGFHFEDENQVSMILLKTNYYPGLLHYFCYTLVQTISEQYRKFYTTENNPPYILDNAKLKTILFENDMNKRIRDKFFLTLELDIKYLKIAYVMAFLFTNPIDDVPSGTRGYTAEQIEECSKDLLVPSLLEMSGNDFINYLQELTELGVFSKFTDPRGKTLYKFRKYDFSRMFGNEDEICDKLMEVPHHG